METENEGTVLEEGVGRKRGGGEKRGGGAEGVKNGREGEWKKDYHWYFILRTGRKEMPERVKVGYLQGHSY